MPHLLPNRATGQRGFPSNRLISSLDSFFTLAEKMAKRPNPLEARMC
jgi:hypothetical protein